MRGRGLAVIALVVGTTLLCVSLVGLNAEYDIPSYAKRPPSAKHLGPARDIDLGQRRGEADRRYFARVTRAVHERMYYGWDSENERVALLDNWLLNAAGRVLGTYEAYEFSDAERALNRGWGVCSQMTNVVFEVLDKSGFEPNNVLLPDHTVIDVRDRSGRPAVLDPTYGVVIDASISELRDAPSLLAREYGHIDARNLAPGTPEGDELVSTLSRAYGDDTLAVNSGRVTPRRATIEPWAYRLKWGVPIALVLLGIATLRRLPR